MKWLMKSSTKVDFEEFLLLFKFKQYLDNKKEDSSDSTKKMFDLFDKDQTGYLSADEWLEVLNISVMFKLILIMQVLKLMGIETTAEEASKLFSLVDANQDGKISVREFTEYIGK